MRRGKRFVQVEVHDVKAHVAGARRAHDRVHVRAVVVAKSARVVDDLRDLQNVFIEDSERVRIRQHQPRGVGPDVCAKGTKIHRSVRRGGNVDHRIARHARGCGVCSVRGVRHDNLLARAISARLVMALHEQ